MKIYKGDYTYTTAEEWKKFVAEYDQVSGSIYMSGCTGLTSVTFPGTVDGYIYMSGCTGLTSVTFPKSCGSIYVDETSSEWLISCKHEKLVFQINHVAFDKALFDQVRTGEISAAEVFAITNMEQRRVAYELMDKAKIAELPDLAVLDTVDNDGCGYPMRIISFTHPDYDTPFYYLNCFCPSTGREYYPETRETTCWAAKMASFGLPADFRFDAEY